MKTYQEALRVARENIVVRLSGKFGLTQHLQTEEYGYVPYWNGGDLDSLLGIIDPQWALIEEWYWDEKRQQWRIVQQA